MVEDIHLEGSYRLTWCGKRRQWATATFIRSRVTCPVCILMKFQYDAEVQHNEETRNNRIS